MALFLKDSVLEAHDPDAYRALSQELERQQNSIELIASENIVSKAVLTAQGSIFTNKYAEGYPGKRYYGGCEFADEIENLAINRAKKIFNAEHVNVQAHSGSQANMAAFTALLEPGDTILGMGLNAGGHLTHGFHLNFSGFNYKAYAYDVDPQTFLLDYNTILKQAKEIKPKMIIAGASAYSRIIDFNKFREIADEVGAFLLVDMAHIAGLVAVGLHPNPVPYADIVTSTTHKTLRGPRGGLILCKQDHARAVDKAIFPGIQGGPLMHVIMAKAIAFKEALDPSFKTYQEQVIRNSQALAKGMYDLGYSVITKGTDNHLSIIDLRDKELNGKQVENALDTACITLNKNSIPYDTAPPMQPSGIRIGSPAVTSRGFKEKEMQQIVLWLDKAICSKADTQTLNTIKAEVQELCASFPIYN
ncbi:glycine hydroxymethyltransferase [Brevinema andersonii]|uniref:Serine hydroxymethyltransferase n=1 Tax=Brevinema andersonii TaxID=34097 RepID=A0A1I1DVS8_BREAD|nr:serine hydroxymethyltransferase [Brevinema andersonii]SFB78914.1 glycine hydroxymethyltransferase [Brevinema andersonii]